ncbi:alpha-L-rhamnosidase [Streptomyces fulvoviolaceus]|uniref:alpha-L-rhamnosidase n=1 Tax=Streptomyces fulvoviolaceus TaxID=285535 RepID=UPI0021C187F5|nr:alpha-L-rhamnosidase [Streptomyces fulvoviolaceus]MCT9075654.1 glycoside hydrolase family 78 protein [Streptomyces fulvoviolaceus]
MKVAAPVFEHHREPLGIGERRPRLSWRTGTDRPGWWQSAYEIELVDGSGTLTGGTGRVASDESVLVPWPGPELESRIRVGARVRVWDAEGRVSAWSPVAYAETGLLGRADWTARPIAPDLGIDPGRPQPVVLLRRAFHTRGPIASARLYVTALGVFQPELNGRPVGEDMLAPGWSSYHHRLRCLTYDVTGLLRDGENVLGAQLGEGWYSGRLGFHGGRRAVYGERPALLAQLEIVYADGSRETIATDERWQAATGPVIRSELYDGEEYDARLERTWHDTEGWGAVTELPLPHTGLESPPGPPVRRTGTLRPVEVLTTPAGRTVLDFGQNLVGRLRIRVKGAAGETVTLRHAEVLENGELALRPLRVAEATDRYTLKGAPEGERYEPLFTFHGFRYAQVDGWPGALDPSDIEAVVLHTDMERTGWFECSEPLVDQLHANVVWGMRGNFLDVPTDCLQRDERLGWTGDIAVFSPAATFLYDCSGMLSSWLRDLAAEQLARTDGAIPPLVVPDALPAGFPNAPTAIWGDSAVLVPWALYQAYGDRELLRTQWESMSGWADELERYVEQGGGLWRADFQFGDWLDPAAPPENPGAARTDPDLVANAYTAHTAAVMAQVADLLDEPEHARRYAQLAARVRAAFADEFVTPGGLLSSDAQTAYTLALRFALLPTARQRERAGERLVEIVRRAGFRIGTGFAGTPLICDALTLAGAPEIAYRMLLETGCPSWLYPVTMGATTVWERWDSMLPDGTMNPGEMTSFNHYALGAVADWLHRTVAGLGEAGPGRRKLRIAPVPGGGLTHARAVHESPYGRCEAGWERDGDTLTVTAVVPPNTTAVVELPDGKPAFEVGSGTHTFTVNGFTTPTWPPTPIRHPFAAPEDTSGR